METGIEKYCIDHTNAFDESFCEALDWIEKQTNIRTNYPHMLCGKAQGAFLKLLAELCHSSHILEIGTFTGYSAACLAKGLEEGGRIDTIEINDELETLCREGWKRCGVESEVNLIIGDALEILPGFGQESFDLVFIDANKREYLSYFEKALPLLKKGGIIAFDDTLWDGKVALDSPPTDKQTLGILALNESLEKDSRVETVMIPLRHGLSLVRKK